MEPVIAFDHATRVFMQGRRGRDVVAIDDITFDLAPNEFVSLVGPSGSGKTTILRLAAGLDFP
jgi:NitT/TauT family transport system ATP-binding protein